MILEVNGITKLYKSHRGAEDITFQLSAGDVYGLLGPNGSGKTTIMKIITSLISPQRGSVSIEGIDIMDDREKAMEKVGALIEAPALIEYVSPRDNLKMASRYYKNVTDNKINETLEICGISRYKNDKISTFSLGMRQRTGLALALLSEPSLLILDEPANGLDIEGMVQIREIVIRSASLGAAVLISSHLAHEIELCANRVGVMYEGKMLREASMQQVKEENPALEDFFLSEVSRFRKGVSA